MSDPPPSKRRRLEDNEEASQPGRPAEPGEVIFVYTGQPVEEIPRNITQLVVDPSVTTIEDQAFMNNCQLRSVTIPSTVEVIGREAFRGCISLTHVHLHRGLKTIGDGAFRKCTSLLEVELPNGISYVATETFAFCKALCTVVLPITLKRIGSQAFRGCISLVDTSLPKRLKRIDSQAFRECTALSSISLPSSLEAIGQRAFFLCKGLLSVEFPSSSKVKTSVFCFAGAHSLVNVSVPRCVGSFLLFGSHGIQANKREFLTERFSNLPVHRLCYRSAPVTKNKILRILDSASTLDEPLYSLKDAFEMTPFHILATSASLNTEILECLLERYPIDILGYKDSYGNMMVDYLLKHTSPRAVPLLQVVLRRAVVDTISTWYPQGNWGTNLSMMVEAIPHNSDMNGRRQCVKGFFGQVGYCSRVEITSI